MAIINNDYTKEVGIIDMSNLHNIILKFDSGVLKGYDKTTSQEITIGGGGGGSITGSGISGQMAFFSGNTVNLGSTGSVNGSITYDNTNGLIIDSINSSYGLILSNNTNNQKSQIYHFDNSLIFLNEEDAKQNINIGSIILNKSSSSKTISLSDTNSNLQCDSKNVILGTTDGVNTRIPYFDSSNTLNSTNSLTFTAGSNILNCTSINATTSLSRNNVSVICSNNGSVGKIPIFDTATSITSNNNLSFNINTGTLTSGNINTTSSLTRGNKNVITTNNTTTVNNIPFYQSANQVTDSNYLKWDNTNSQIIMNNISNVPTYYGTKNITFGGYGIVGFINDYPTIVIGNDNETDNHIENEKHGNSIMLLNSRYDRDNSISRDIDKTIISSKTPLDGDIPSVTTIANINKSKKSEVSFYKNDISNTEPFFRLNVFRDSIVNVELRYNILITDGISSGVDYIATVYEKYGFSSNQGVITQLSINSSLTSYTIKNSPYNKIMEIFQNGSPKNFNGIGTNITTDYRIDFYPIITNNYIVTRIDGIATIVETRF
jgi:hypothetical protein